MKKLLKYTSRVLCVSFFACALILALLSLLRLMAVTSPLSFSASWQRYSKFSVPANMAARLVIISMKGVDPSGCCFRPVHSAD